MKITGIIAEYNPFHKGHEYQIRTSRELSKPDGIVVVMSGNYVQRGEPAIIDKWSRAQSAIYGGADLVIELPMPFACQNAEIFSMAAISELRKLSITHLSFGCEDDNLERFKYIASIQTNNNHYDTILQRELGLGISYPTAVTNTLCEISNTDIADIIKSPNNVLGLEYIKSSIKLSCNWDFVPVKRIGKNHNDIDLSGSFDSATALRRSILNNEISSCQNSLTEKSYEMINNFYGEYGGFNCLNNYLNYMYYKISDMGVEGLNEIYGVSEGLNNKIYDNMFKYKDVDDYIMSLKSKRYTYAKLRRILLNILLNITYSDVKSIMSTHNSYIKVLAFNNVGAQILKNAQNIGTCAINRFSDYKKFNINIKSNGIFKLTDKSTNMYYLPFDKRDMNCEYIRNPKLY